MRLDGQIALVTGSTRGIGWATARSLARAGATVVLSGHSDPALLARRAEELSAESGRPVQGIPCDVSSTAAVRALFQEIFRTHRRLDVLVNNAGVMEDALLGMIEDALVERVLGVNVRGAINVLQGAARLMARTRSGCIVNVSSIVGVRGNVGQAVYSASKAAIVGLTLSASKELAPQGIRVNAIAPGFIDTDMTRALPPEKFRDLAARIGMGRVGTPEDVAGAVLFLCSELAAYVTGQVLGVDGGMQV
ncbi:SDR family NAD(P)-dependent oxidoreductase [Anaeromyxobacter paludicola]|uniref:3-oxoacyl-ACP reductase n=1 Tax=Anaeromyxobacter paludicola TaxID=2918171 RepID=A0ABN6N1I6_9BACT|nr:3-oxoacyl-ACP reductase FabG [Anaeromyxobacter paludicola]BDG07089.1 3-oxoacyl-ACP reductase [Anaeromyxobacter paludicola]